MAASAEQVARLLGEVERLRDELDAIVHVCRSQAMRAGPVARLVDPCVAIVESIALEALHPRRDRRRPEDTACRGG